VVTIEDRPRFAWRGLLIDVGRHFIPLDELKRNLDGMAAVKMNVLHWHLYDNEGFRVESKRFPRLQQAGSDGLYYTQADIRDFVAYAHDRGICVVPEFEMGGRWPHELRTVLRISHPYEPALLRTHLDISLSVKLRLLGVLGLLILRSPRG